MVWCGLGVVLGEGFGSFDDAPEWERERLRRPALMVCCIWDRELQEFRADCASVQLGCTRFVGEVMTECSYRIVGVM